MRLKSRMIFPVLNAALRKENSRSHRSKESAGCRQVGTLHWEASFEKMARECIAADTL